MPNSLDTAKALYDAYAKRDIDGVMDRIADDMIFRWPAQAEFIPISGTWDGKAGFLAFLQSLGERYNFDRFEPIDMIADGERVAARITMTVTNKATGRQASFESAQFWRFRDGKAVELIEIFDTAAVASIG